ncbi:MAG: LytTR family DNA-binding domain-containing protein [Bacteroidota bacterium]
MKKLTAIALDDERSSLEVLEHHAAKVDFVDLKEVFTSPSKVLDYLQTHEVQLLFLDIEMPDINGLEIAKMIDRHQTKVILVTAFSEYALGGFEVEAIDYLMKPVAYNRFLRACLKAKDLLVNDQEETPDFIFVKDGYQLTKVKLSDIRYIKSDANLLNIYTATDRIITRMTMTRMLEILPKNRYHRVHKSYIVHLPSVQKVDQQFVYMADIEIPISSAYRDTFNDTVKRFLKH